MSQTNWEADKMLDVYIHDYFVKRKLHASAKAFQHEGKVSSDPVAIDAPGGFLFEWWSVFWDIFIARTNEKHSDHAASYIETQMSKAREHQQLQKSQHIHIQQLMLQRQAQQQQQQQQRRDGGQLINSNTNGITSADPLIRPNTGSANALATKMYEDKLKLPQASEDIKQRFGDNVGGHLLDPNQASILKSAAVGVQHQGQALHGTPGSMPRNLHHFQNQSPQLPLSAQDSRPEMNSMINARAGGPGGLEGSLMGISGSNQGGNNLTLRGLPLTGFDSLRPGILPTQKTMIPSSQSLQQFQLQQQLILQAQQGLAFPSMDLETKRRILLNSNRNVSLRKDGHLNTVGEVVPNIGSPVPVSCPVLPSGDSDMLMKQHLPNNNPSQPQNSQNALSSQSPQIPNQLDASVSNSFRGNDQASKVQIGRKRKQPVSSSGPANSTGTTNTAGPSPGSAPSTPSTHTPGEMTMPNIPHNNGSSKPSLMFGSDSVGTLTSAPHQLADMSRFSDEATLDDNVESFLSQEEGDQRDTMGRGMEVSKGFSFKELALIQASASKVNCCHFSLDGNLLATGGHDKKVVLWFTDTQKPKSTLEEHTQMITDVRFSPSMCWLATSSFDRTVRVWEVENTAGYSIRNFTGHSSSVMSLDFHPTDHDVICSNDSNGEIRVWSISHGSCPKVFEGGSVQVRFQPRHGKYLAAVSESVVNIIDFNTWECVEQLQGHSSKLHSVCWDFSGERLACVSEEMIRVWSVVSGGDWQCIHELNCTGNKFNTCVFHPVFSSLLIIGCYQNMELWNMAENKTMTLEAHEGQITSLATSTISSLIASASHDKCVKLWK